MIYKSKARYEGGGVHGVTRLIVSSGNAIATERGTFTRRRDGKWRWVIDDRVELFPIEKKSKP